jgi:hypothetical protein
LVCFTLGGLLLTACGEKDDPKPQPQPTANTLTLELEHHGSDGQVLAFNKTYHNALGQPYVLNTLLYYVSNVKLTRADGTVWTEPNSYHLVRVQGAPNANPAIALANVPFGNYTKLTMSFGVDAAANTSTDKVGDLDPGNGMAWDWTTGYRFMVMEGEYRPAGYPVKDLTYHIGTNAAYRTMELALPEPATVMATVAPQAHVLVDINTVFGGPNQMDFSQPEQLTVMHNPAQLVRVADNVRTIFAVEHVHND